MPRPGHGAPRRRSPQARLYATVDRRRQLDECAGGRENGIAACGYLSNARPHVDRGGAEQLDGAVRRGVGIGALGDRVDEVGGGVGRAVDPDDHQQRNADLHRHAQIASFSVHWLPMCIWDPTWITRGVLCEGVSCAGTFEGWRTISLSVPLTALRRPERPAANLAEKVKPDRCFGGRRLQEIGCEL
jgi:hypothetical protein